jgi:hypothetical protein
MILPLQARDCLCFDVSKDGSDFGPSRSWVNAEQMVQLFRENFVSHFGQNPSRQSHPASVQAGSQGDSGAHRARFLIEVLPMLPQLFRPTVSSFLAETIWTCRSGVSRLRSCFRRVLVALFTLVQVAPYPAASRRGGSRLRVHPRLHQNSVAER